MEEVPLTRYTSVGDSDVAFQVVGDGPVDLLHCGGVGHIDLQWDYPPWAALHRKLASFSRLILFDRRGTGASDPGPRNGFPTWEEWTEDITAVLDAAGSERAAIFAEADAGPIALLYAAMHPERVRALILANTTARFLAADDYPIGHAPEAAEFFIELMKSAWGTPAHASYTFPSRTGDTEFIRFIAKYLRAIATPRTAAAQYRYIYDSLDVRGILPLVKVPVLLIHHRRSPFVPLEHSRFLADAIASAVLVELPGDDTVMTPFDADEWVPKIAEFLTGRQPVVEVDRVLTTMLFTDIVGSTERLAAVGDGRWRSTLDAHYRSVRQQLSQFRGKEIRTMGDGFFASFDGPARAVRCAHAIADAARSDGLEVRAGLHTGECEVHGSDLAGVAVHVAARVGALAGPAEVLVSSTVKDLVAGSGLEFLDRGLHALKGLPDRWHLYALSA